MYSIDAVDIVNSNSMMASRRTKLLVYFTQILHTTYVCWNINYHWMRICKNNRIPFRKLRWCIHITSVISLNYYVNFYCEYACPRPTCDALSAAVTWRSFSRLAMSHYKLLQFAKESRHTRWKPDKIHVSSVRRDGVYCYGKFQLLLC